MKKLIVLLQLLLSVSILFAQNTITVTGKVTDATNQPIPGVSVTVKGTAQGTITNVDGNYSVPVAPQGTLVFSFVGMLTQEIPVNNRPLINVQLGEQTIGMEEVVVVGYGSQRKIEVTGSVTQIKGEELSKQSTVNPISALQGKVAGVQITNSGAPGASPEIRIRGVGTIYGNANPLYVVDGVWYDDISFLSPGDIESLNILKDASSESIYGIRAANGVVLISTRKGAKNTHPMITYSGYVGNQVVTNQIKMANGPEFATITNELDVANKANPRYADPNSFGTTDWYHQILGNALTTSHQISVAGGSDLSTYSLSLGYLKQDGIVKTNTFDRYTARFQNDLQLFDFLKVGYSLTGSVNNSKDIDGGIFHQLYAAAPIVPVYYADGTYGDPNDFKVGNSNVFNPQVTMDYFNQKSVNYRFSGNIFADVNLAKHLIFHTSAGTDFGQNEVRKYLPVYTATLSQRNATSLLTKSRGETRNWLVENTLTYDNQLGDHGIKIMVGQSAQSYKYNSLYATAQNVPNNSSGDFYLTLGDPSTRFISEGTAANVGVPFLNRVVSYFGRVNYSYKSKYLFTGSLRGDGSSKFSGGNQWGVFPSLGAGWVISQEGFMANQQIFNVLKLRGSWGKIGNVSVPANLSVLTVTGDYVYVGGDGSTSGGASITTIVPPTTYWERGNGYDIGLEFGIWESRLSGEIDFYNRKTEKAIFDIPILGSLGTTGSSIIGNQATFQNQGLEFLLNWKDRINTDMNYSLSANMSFNQNKVLAVSTGANPIYQAVGTTGSNNFNTRTVVGQPIGQFYGLQVIGVFQNANEISNYKTGSGTVIQPTAVPGDFKFSDINDDGIIDDKDRVVLGNPNPKFTYGFNTNFSYKAFDLTLDFQGVAGVEIYNANLGLRYGTENFSKDYFDKRWHGEGTSNTYPSANIGGGQNYRSNSFYVESGSYFRVRNAQLGFTFPKLISDRIKLDRLRIFVNAQNALNIFNYRGFSPEIGGGPTRAGVDVNVYPLYATYTFGVNVTF
jgi:TonB-linked SusC/RagA family outer membrane protein